jgi:predicted transcriptional regulator
MGTQALLTETELEMMTAIWKLGEGSVKDVLEALPRSRKLATTTVSTMLRILEQKGYLKARKEGRGHVYVPAVGKPEYESRSLRHLVTHVVEGERVGVIRQLLGSEKLSAAELQEIRALLEGSRGGHDPKERA